MAGMTYKITSWSFQDLAEFLRENDFEFMEGLDGSNGAWVKLEENGEPGVMFEIKFKPTQYGAKEINRIMRLSKIPENKWEEWAKARKNEAGS